MIAGIDISAVQGVLDWTRVDPLVRFAIHRCGVGNDTRVKDGCFDANIAGARESGRTVGLYHFPYPLPTTATHADRDPLRQANAHFNASAGVGTSGHNDLPPMMDLEWPEPSDWGKWGCSEDEIKAWCVAYLAEMDRLTGRVTGIYIYPDFQKHLGNGSPFAGRPLWLASYAPRPLIVEGWSAPAIWQTTGGGGRLYTGAPVDTDVIDDDAFAALTLS